MRIEALSTYTVYTKLLLALSSQATHAFIFFLSKSLQRPVDFTQQRITFKL